MTTFPFRFRRCCYSVKTKPSICIHLGSLSHSPTASPPSLFPLPSLSFIYLADMQPSFALAALSIKRHLLLVIPCSPSCPEHCRWVSAVFCCTVFLFFHSDEMSFRLKGRLCRDQVSATSWGMFISGKVTFITALRLPHFWRYFVKTLHECVKWEFRVLLKDISQRRTVDWHTAYYCKADPVKFQVQDTLWNQTRLLNTGCRKHIQRAMHCLISLHHKYSMTYIFGSSIHEAICDWL